VGQDAHDVAEGELGVELVQPRRGDEREQVASGLGVVIGADEQPRVPADRTLRSSRSEALLVGSRPIVEIARERALLANGRLPQLAPQVAHAADLDAHALDALVTHSELRRTCNQVVERVRHCSTRSRTTRATFTPLSPAILRR
jgi:hypothetical protein